MDAARFETIARRNGFRPQAPRVMPRGRLLIAERLFNVFDMADSPAVKDGVFPVLAPHWCTLWVLDRDGLDVGQYVYHGTNTSREARIDDVRRAAVDWIESNVRLRRYA